MSAKKKPVSTPLHLLQQLSDSLLEHLEEACAQALADAEKLLSKLEKQRVKAQDKLHDARAKLQDSAKAGKAKAQGKAQKVAGELEELLDSLKQRQSETRTYIQQLKRDAQESLKLAQGVGKVREAASKALEQRTTDAKAGPADAPNKAAPAPGKPAPAKPVPRKPAPGKPAPGKPAAGRTTASTSASSAAAVPAAGQPAPRKPAVKPVAAEAEPKPTDGQAATPAGAAQSSDA